MIRLNTKNGGFIILAAEHIRKIEQSGNGDDRAYVDGVYVTESPEEVARKVLEYKLAMERYKASSLAAYTWRANDGENPYTPPLDQMLIFDRLAGLGESQ